MQNKGVLTVKHEKKLLNIPIQSILYVIMSGNNAMLHLVQDKVYQVRMTLSEIEPVLGDGFIKVKRGCLVSVIAIHNFTDKVNLINGEELDYAYRNRKEIAAEFHAKQAELIRYFNMAVDINTAEEYHGHYKLFDTFPIAFCDIEMVFDDEFNAVDWIFRYANSALAELERVPLDKLIGSSFGELFPNMEAKWLRAYERAALFNETVKLIDYSSEIDTYLDILCFPTFKGHCGCVLLDIKGLRSYRRTTDAEKAMVVFFKQLMNVD